MKQPIKDQERIQSVAAKIKKLRIDAGYSSYENFAIDNDLPTIQYWRIETGTNLTLKSLFKILNIHKISLNDFFSDIE